jgi:hypothetical protein
LLSYDFFMCLQQILFELKLGYFVLVTVFGFLPILVHAVVCDPHLVIFPIKEIHYRRILDVNIAMNRWDSRAVDHSGDLTGNPQRHANGT